jgi:hypothetical protein
VFRSEQIFDFVVHRIVGHWFDQYQGRLYKQRSGRELLEKNYSLQGIPWQQEGKKNNETENQRSDQYKLVNDETNSFQNGRNSDTRTVNDEK